MASVPNDEIKYIFNVFTGNLDAVLKFNADRIVTNFLNSAGNPRVIYNPETATFIADGPTVVIDNAGNVVVRGT